MTKQINVHVDDGWWENYKIKKAITNKDSFRINTQTQTLVLWYNQWND